MKEEVKKLKELIEASGRILVSAHISPDPDAVSSLLLVGTAIEFNFPDKKVSMMLEEEPLDLDFLYGYSDIEFKKLLPAIKEFQPQLIIIVDGNNFNRCSRLEGDAVREYVHQNSIKTVIIDHHEPVDKDESEVFINRMQPAAAQTAYELLFKDMGFKRPDGAVETAMTGFYSDTGGFVYLKAGGQTKVFDFAEELVRAGADVEKLRNRLSSYTSEDMKVLAELAGNIGHHGDYTYSYVSDTFVDKWIKNGNSHARLQKAAGIFLDEFIRNIDGRSWGFIAYKNTLQGKNMYSASFRAVSDTKDVSAIANSLGGGGHKPAAGAKFEAKSVKDALGKVKAVI